MSWKNWPIWVKYGIIILIILLLILANDVFINQDQIVFSSVLALFILLIASLISLWSSFCVSKKFALMGWKKLSILLGIIASLIVFFIFSFILPRPLIDARTNEGYPTFYNIEFQGYLAFVEFLFVFIFKFIKLISFKNSKEYYSENSKESLKTTEKSS